VPDQLTRIARRWYVVPAGLRTALAVDNPAVGACVREPVVPAVDPDAVVTAALYLRIGPERTKATKSVNSGPPVSRSTRYQCGL
jgi:hypothetical protein